MRFLILILILVLLSNLVSAEITVTSDKATYNLGDKLRTSYEISHPSSFEGFFKLELECDSYNVDYYMVPVSLSGSEKTTNQVPGLLLASNSLGECTVHGNLLDSSLQAVEQEDSSEFKVTNKLQVNLKSNKEVVKPGEEFELTIELERSLYKGEVLLIADEIGTKKFKAISSFSETLSYPEDTQSGEKKIRITVEDSYGNEGDGFLTLKVAQVPEKLNIELNSVSFTPGDTARILVTLLDQSGKEIKSEANIQINSKDAELIYSTQFITGDVVNRPVSNKLVPGTYTVAVSSSGLQASTSFQIQEVEALDVSIDDRFLKIINTGNVPYKDTFEITFSSTAKNKVIPLKIPLDLQINEYFVIDLFKELPGGVYDITFDGGTIKSVSVTDERSLVKKLSDSVGITGSVVETNSGNNRNIVALFLALLFIALLIFLFLKFKPAKKGGKKSMPKIQREIREKELFLELREKQPKDKEKNLRNDPETQRFIDDSLKKGGFK